MKEKLEAVTGSSRKNSVRSDSNRSDDQQRSSEVKKLAENRKLLLEQKLGGGKPFLDGILLQVSFKFEL